MLKNVKRKLSLKKVTISAFKTTVYSTFVTEGIVFIVTTATGNSLTSSSDMPTCRFHTLK